MRCSLRGVVVVMAVASALGAAARVSGGTEGKEAEWSAEVNGVRGRVKLERTSVSNGTGLISTRLELKNVQDVGNALKFAMSRAKLTFRVEDGVGKELPTYNGPFDGRVPGEVDLVLPFKGELSFDISGRGAGIGGDRLAQIDLGPMSTWVIPRDGKEYVLKMTLEIGRVGKDPSSFGWYGKLEIPAVKIPTKGEAMDAAAAGKLIEELGPKILEKDSRVSEEALRRLSLIEDERVIPWYLKAIETDNYGLKFEALGRLSRFEGDEALGGLKKGMATQGKDIGNCTTAKVAEECAANIRHSTSVALARSPHPEAKKLLLTMWQDSYDGVRLTVVQTAQNMDSAESLAVMEKMTKDGDEVVRGEAVRCLKVRRERGEGARGDAGRK